MTEHATSSTSRPDFHNMDCGIAGGWPHSADLHCPSHLGSAFCNRETGHIGSHHGPVLGGGSISWETEDA